MTTFFAATVPVEKVRTKATRERGQLCRHLFVAVFGAFVLSLCSNVRAQVSSGALRLVPVKSGSKVRLIYGKKSVVLNLEDAEPFVLPGDEPHRYKVLLTARKDKTLYLLASVCSRSPISNPNAPCGGDRPCSLLWIKSDESLEHREVEGRIYASCSYNYYPAGGLRMKAGKLTIIYREGVDYGDEFELTYDNSQPEKGVMLKKLGSFGDKSKRSNQ